ncbi:pyridoxal phosphate-dependent aminotransferase [Nocardia sp. NPDC049220]|uniref:pyridoxal phosphate-dependent aminotransferase n=1 Tax=Nocardia sp. NPDC049220 TaxID=3155273 RepID=UPI0033DB1843
MMISRRAELVVAYSYDDFPLQPGQLDLRGDNSPPLPIVSALSTLPGQHATDLAFYGDIAGEPGLRGAFAHLFGVRADQVLVTAGGSEALFLALTCITDHGDTVVIPRPGFPGFEELARLSGLRVTPYDVPGVLPRCGREPLLVCTPHNPTGVVTAPIDIDGTDGWTIWDISHMSPVGGRIADFASHLGNRDIIVFSLSKLLRLPGARVGCLVACDSALLAAATRAKTHLSMSTGRLGQDLAQRVLHHPTTEIDLAARMALFAEQRTQMLDAVAASRRVAAVPAADGTHVYLRTIDGCDGWRLLAEVGVAGLPGVVFNGPSDAVRLCIAQTREVLDQAAQRVSAL